jgi:hypothetical protein
VRYKERDTFRLFENVEMNERKSVIQKKKEQIPVSQGISKLHTQ